MSRKTSNNKKRRLQSEVSQTSGISMFSSVTQSTEVSDDSEDRKSDSSLANQNTGLRGSNSNIFDGVQPQVTDYAHSPSHKLQRKRQVSWSLCGDEEETLLKYISQERRTSPTRPSLAPYDNNINGTNNRRRRTRRATESCLETQGLSYIDPQSHICSPHDTRNMQTLRSNTTSELHTHENEIQKQRLLTQMIQEFDDSQRRQRAQQRRSHSATSLQDHRLYATPSPGCNQCQYDPVQQWNRVPAPNSPVQCQHDPVQQWNRAPAPNSPVETIVNIANSDPNYLHPITQVKRTPDNTTGTTEHQIVNDWPEMSVGSGYAHVNGPNDQSKFIRNCNNSFYRKGFFVLLVLNVIFVLLNVVGLPFLYFAIEAPGLDDTPKVGAQRSDICVKCEGLDAMVRTRLAESGVYKSKDGQCCVSSVDKLLPAIMEVTDVLAWHTVQENKNEAKTAVVQLNASTDNTNATNNKIMWDKRPVINNFDVQIIDNYMLQIPTTGYYYVFSRVHYKQKNFISGTNQFTIGHSLIKQDFNDRSSENAIDTIVMRCFPDFSTGDVRHTNHLSSIHYLHEGDRLFIKLDHKTFFDPTNTMFGIFLIAT